MSKLNQISSSNWKDFFNNNLCFVMFTKSNCERCKIFEERINEANIEQETSLTKLTLDTPGFAELKRNYPWISRIDTLPFNAIFSRGVLIDSWSGSNIETLQYKLKEFQS